MAKSMKDLMAGGSSAPKTESPVPAPVTDFLPPRIMINTCEGWGKTTIGAYMPKPVMVMIGDEDGYKTLLSRGLVPSIPAVEIKSFEKLDAFLDWLIEVDPLPYKTVVFDSLGWMENLIKDYVVDKCYEGDSGEKGFSGFQRGWNQVQSEYLMLQKKFEKIRARKIMLLFLGHIEQKNFHNPDGDDYSRWSTSVNQKIWKEIFKWVDEAYLGRFLVQTKKGRNDAKVKAVESGTNTRLLFTQNRASSECKSRVSLPPVVQMPDDHTKAWNHLSSLLFPKPVTTPQVQEK